MRDEYVSNGSDSMGGCLTQPLGSGSLRMEAEGSDQGGTQAASDTTMASPRAQVLF